MSCVATDDDADADGLSDACELGLADAFAPTLIARSGGCNWDANAQRLAGGYFYAVQPVESVVRIVYMPAYFRDCGWAGVKCVVPWLDCSSHNGDSEAIAIDVQRDHRDNPWRAIGIFLSAHCFGRSGGDCRWYRGDELAGFAWDSSAPIVWVAEGRQANYRSQAACDGGHYSVDTCDHHDARYRFPIERDRNIGSAARPTTAGGCVDGSALESDRVAADAIECFWRADTPFRGWQQEGAGATGYLRYLRLLGF